MRSKPHISQGLHGSATSRPRRPMPSSKAGGDQSGLNLRGVAWSSAAENELTGRGVPGAGSHPGASCGECRIP